MSVIPGPSLLALLRQFWRKDGSPLTFVTHMAERYGPIARIGWGRWQFVFISDPELIRQILVVQADACAKDHGFNATRIVLGNGLLTSEGEFHMRQRRLAQPAFQRDKMAGYGEVMVRCAQYCCDGWRHGQKVDISQEMMNLTLDIVSQTLFGLEVRAEMHTFAESLEYCMERFKAPRIGFLPLLHRLPLPSTRRFFAHRARLIALIEELIARKRRSGPGQDLLSLLLGAQEGGTGMSDAQLRDECMTLFLAGHETTANALTWTFHLLDHHPEVALSLCAELSRELGERPVTYADVPRLVYTEKVLRESMRLFPPAWIVGRSALRPLQLGPYVLPAGAQVAASQWVMHRKEEYYLEPERFHPERWTPEFIQRLPRFAYFPFGGGNRICVAEHFAKTEAILVLATILRQWRFVDSPQRVAPKPHITLRPGGGIPGRVLRV